ncbi:allatostatins isoform X2 [Belonocnema kinseyi]|nr:allatostatins isoform X2 [Belonocnema kinseyi]XP_033217940.1 allatostatins isoform X2 [Belonocnema kinseyi]XP_033217941.1 allatostatins isoform X2 [Belonocnema kinseyi]XP_033217943.1 allatostatins isoform X2 [Belonocnema kinseyi]XP_033217944.1 allatostatins isoform X2 [Belonocnema kinseyi]XP_033217945.1 allatostatins isoform X2 [Belonocnema kinseyi]
MISIKMFVFCVMTILGCFSIALDARSSFENVNNEYIDYVSNSLSAQNLPQKRYTYVSEYKRLPVYNFGIGKRARPYEFGAGRRSKAYSFGVGKRFNYDEQHLDYVSDAAYNSNPRDLVDNQSKYKRGPSQRFSFGVGKRGRETTLSNSENAADNIKKPKNKTYDINLYEIYNLMRNFDKENAPA